jgi:hypothetical protein
MTKEDHMRRMKLIVELTPQELVMEMAAAAREFDARMLRFDTTPFPRSLVWDLAYSPVEIPAVSQPAALADFGAFGPPIDEVAEGGAEVPGVTFAVRAEIDEEDLGDFLEQAQRSPSIQGVFVDELIQAFPTCISDPAVGTDKDVAKLLCVDDLHKKAMTGAGVLLAVVDGGVNLAHLKTKGKPLPLDSARSWSYHAGTAPGAAPVGHGTMCAFDAAIAAPVCTLADLVVLRKTKPGESLHALLSDAVKAYQHLLQQIRSHGLFTDYRGLVVSNSWGVYHPSFDKPVGSILNYSDNPNHTFNRIVATLERYGADIVFAAGNCGKDCPSPFCLGVTSKTIYGANSHPSVLCVGGVDVHKTRVGYSSTGPGRLMVQKPDLCAYTHFSGSGVRAVDSGTSAAAPVAAGVLAALRSVWSYDVANPARHPANLRQHVIDNVDPVGLTGHSSELGWGILDGCKLVGAKLEA